MEARQIDWHTLYLTEKARADFEQQRADALAALLKRRHALDPLEVAEALAAFAPTPKDLPR